MLIDIGRIDNFSSPCTQQNISLTPWQSSIVQSLLYDVRQRRLPDNVNHHSIIPAFERSGRLHTTKPILTILYRIQNDYES